MSWKHSVPPSLCCAAPACCTHKIECLPRPPKGVKRLGASCFGYVLPSTAVLHAGVPVHLAPSLLNASHVRMADDGQCPSLQQQKLLRYGLQAWMRNMLSRSARFHVSVLGADVHAQHMHLQHFCSVDTWFLSLSKATLNHTCSGASMHAAAAAGLAACAQCRNAADAARVSTGSGLHIKRLALFVTKLLWPAEAVLEAA